MRTNYLFDEFLGIRADFFNSRKYWIVYLCLILSYFLVNWYVRGCFGLNHIFALFLLSFLGIFCISYFYGHNDDVSLYKTTFIIILIFGVVFSFFTPMLFVHDEVEHFVRAEMISRGIIFPEYFETSYVYEGIPQRGYYLTVQSTLDLIKDTKTIWPSGHDQIVVGNVFVLDAIDMPINSTLVKYHSAFAQNPFYGYIAPAFGILLAKLLGLNAVWMVWLGRLCNLFLYAFLVSLAIKKSPILKVPLLLIACIPMILFQSASLSIDALINGLGILSVAYFFKMCCSDNLTYANIVKFSFIVLLFGLCKVTYFSFIFLLIFVPRNNFKERKYYYLNFSSIFIILLIGVLWSKYYANPAINESFRFVYFKISNVNPTEQLNYILSHKFNSLSVFFVQFFYNLRWFVVSYDLNELVLFFLIFLSLFYPKPLFSLKSRFGALLVFLILHLGTLFLLVLTWAPISLLGLNGFQSRYIFPALTLLPFIFRVNIFNFNKFKLDLTLFVIMITFISFNLGMFFIVVY